uniref:Annexin n=1 Tax=Cyclopterus lumpus TaxID=8103 RepID=A0A8C2WHL7_CYCLU
INEQRQQIKEAYQKASGKSLESALKNALKGDLEEVVLALLKTPAQYDAHQLKMAMKGLGTDEEVLIEILASRNNMEIMDIKKAYKEDYKKDLENDIKSDTSGDFRAALLELCKASRTEGVCEQMVDSDARALYEAGEGRKGNNCSVFIEVLTGRSAPHLRSVFERYSKYSKVDMSKVIDLEMKGDIESCLTAVVKCAGSRPAFFAEKLNLAMKGKGTRKNTLTRIMVSRSEIDMKRIKDEYKKNYGTTLYRDILVSKLLIMTIEPSYSLCLDVRIGHVFISIHMIYKTTGNEKPFTGRKKTTFFSFLQDDTKGDYEKILLALSGSEN